MNKKVILAAVVFLAALSGYFIYKKLTPKQLPSYLVAAVGRIDGDDILINTKYPGRVVMLGADTGDAVKKGEVVAKLDSKEFEDKLKALEFQIKAKQKELAFNSEKVAETIKKAALNVGIKKDELNALNAQIDSIKKVIAQDRRDERRIASLVRRKLAKEHDLELARLKTKTDTDRLKALLAKKSALQKAVEVAVRELSVAKAATKNIEALKDALNALDSQKAQLQTVISELSLKSPVNGYVDSKISNIGEVVGAGMPVISVIDPQSFYLKIYVDELTNGKIKIGQKAEIFLDSFPDTPIKAVVSKVAKRAEFTPKEVEVRSDRITRVYEVHLKPLEKSPYLKLGLPAIGVIKTGEGGLPHSLNELPKM